MTYKNISPDKTRISYVINKEKLKEFDKCAKKNGLSRSALLTMLIYNYLEEQEKNK